MGRPKTKFNINMPLSWEEITLEMFEEISKLYDNDKKPTITDILSVLTNIKKEELEQYPVEVLNTIISQAQYINTQPCKSDDLSDSIEIDGEKYMINYQEELRFKEFVDSQTLIEGNNRDYASLLAILCRKQNELYNDEYISKEFNKRVDMFLHQPITKILPLVNFFLKRLLVSEKYTQQFLKELKDEASKYLDSIETSVKNGDGKKRFSKSQMKKLATLKQQLNSI